LLKPARFGFITEPTKICLLLQFIGKIITAADRLAELRCTAAFELSAPSSFHFRFGHGFLSRPMRPISGKYNNRRRRFSQQIERDVRFAPQRNTGRYGQGSRLPLVFLRLFDFCNGHHAGSRLLDGVNDDDFGLKA
jgi:hypothetical protein